MGALGHARIGVRSGCVRNTLMFHEKVIVFFFGVMGRDVCGDSEPNSRLSSLHYVAGYCNLFCF